MSAPRLPIIPDLGIHRCWSTEEGEEYEADFCDLYEASETGAPCQGGCYFQPCVHGLQFGCQVPCASCDDPCCWHGTVNSATGELVGICMNDDVPCEAGCKEFVEPARGAPPVEETGDV